MLVSAACPSSICSRTTTLEESGRKEKSTGKMNALAVQNPRHKYDLGNNLRTIQSLTRK